MVGTKFKPVDSIVYELFALLCIQIVVLAQEDYPHCQQVEH